jgi:hypothetical protein
VPPSTTNTFPTYHSDAYRCFSNECAYESLIKYPISADTNLKPLLSNLIIPK